MGSSRSSAITKPRALYFSGPLRARKKRKEWRVGGRQMVAVNGVDQGGSSSKFVTGSVKPL